MSNPKDDIYATDSEDEDYVPPANEESDSEASDGGMVEVAAPKEESIDEEERKRKRDELWASFQASVSEPTESESQPVKEKMVKVERKYRFAGNEVIEVVEVPENSLDAKKWPLWKEPSSGDSNDPPAAPEVAPVAPEAATSESVEAPALDSKLASESASSSSLSKPPAKKPGPRKPKTKLAALPGPAKAKKLTTLDKSAMDWNKHLQAETAGGSTVKDELEANRRGGGYLEKVEFLKRVEDRKEDNLESLKSAKRRKL